MERYTYFEGGKWRIRVDDTEHSGTWVDRLAAYEDTGLGPGEINEARDEAYDLGYQSCLNYKGITWPEAAELQAYRALGTVEELSALVKARDEHKAYKLDGFYCDICKKKHMRVIEIDRVYFTRAEAEAALGGGQT